MSTFRFAIMGAGNIAHQFCDAVTLVEDCEVSAIASKDLERAQKFAEECSVAHAYDNYEQMLIEEKPDCVYIAVTPNDHFRLTMLCLEPFPAGGQPGKKMGGRRKNRQTGSLTGKNRFSRTGGGGQPVSQPFAVRRSCDGYHGLCL